MAKSSPTTTASRLAVRIVAGTAGGGLACAGLVWIANQAGNESLARGISTGGAIGIAAVVALLVASRRKSASAEARLVAGAADERERGIGTAALAHAAVGMYATAVVATMVGAFVEVPVEAGLFSVMVVGLVTAISSYALRVRLG